VLWGRRGPCCWGIEQSARRVQRGSNTLPAHASTVRFHGVHYEADGVVFIPAGSIKGVVGGGEGEGSDTHRRAAGVGSVSRPAYWGNQIHG
jgi:hypothetical protein